VLCNVRWAQDEEDAEDADLGNAYLEKRRKTMAENALYMDSLDKVKVGMTVYVPHKMFPWEDVPEGGYWTGKTVSTSKGGTGDIGIKLPGEEVFTHPRIVVSGWLAPPAPEEQVA